MPSELPRSKEALVFAWGANASALPLFPAGGETDWRIRSTGPQDSFSAVAAAPPPEPSEQKRTGGVAGVMADTCREHTKAPRGWIFSDQGRCGKTADPIVCPSGSKFLVSPYKAPQDKSV